MPSNERTIHASVDAVVDRLATAIAAAGMNVFFTMDHAKAARAVGLSMPEARVLVYGNPRGGTPIMQEHPGAALDLPLRALVRDAGDGRTIVSFHPIVDVLQASGVSPEAASRLVPAQRLLLDTLRAMEEGN